MAETLTLPDVLTIQEVAQFLRVSEEQLRPEIDSGRLRVFAIGVEQRVLKQDLSQFLRLATGWTASSERPRLAKPTPAPRFSFRWPNGEEREYPKAFAGPVRVDDEWKVVQIGFRETVRAGKKRQQAVVFINRRPRAEFLAADDFAKSKLMVSIVKTKAGRHVPEREYVPFEYADLRLEPYNLHVTGPNAFSGLAVVCRSEDLITMMRVALIRETYDSDVTDISSPIL